MGRQPNTRISPQGREEAAERTIAAVCEGSKEISGDFSVLSSGRCPPTRFDGAKKRC